MAGGSSFLQELREFLQFLRSLWGLLAGISTLFPLSSVLFNVIPMEQGGNPFQDLKPDVVPVLATLTCVFVTFATFGRRDQFSDPQRRRRYAISARASFGGAIGAIAIYLLAHRGLYDALVHGVGFIALYDGLFAALYIASFVLLTRAFLLLAMLEYLPEGTIEGSAAPGRP